MTNSLKSILAAGVFATGISVQAQTNEPGNTDALSTVSDSTKVAAQKIVETGDDGRAVLDSKSEHNKELANQRNKHIFDTFTEALKTYGSSQLFITDINGSTVLFKKGVIEGDKESFAMLELPYFDENGKLVSGSVNEFNKQILEFPYEGFGEILGLDNNLAIYIISNWQRSIESKSKDIEYTYALTSDKPFIISGKGDVKSGVLRSNSQLSGLLKNVGFNYQDDLSFEDLNLKATMDFISEATNQGNNSRVAGNLIVIFSNLQKAISVDFEKGDKTARAGVGFTMLTSSGDKISIDYNFFRQFLEYCFPGVAKKYNLAPEQNSLSASYTQYQIEKFKMLKEIVYTASYHDIETIHLGKTGDLSTQVAGTIHNYALLSALRGGNVASIKVQAAFDLAMLLKQDYGIDDLRLDIIAEGARIEYDDVLGQRGDSEIGLGFGAKLTALLLDRTLKASVSANVMNGNERYELSVGKMTSFGKFQAYISKQSYRGNPTDLNSAGIRLNIDLNEKKSNGKYSPLFVNDESKNYLNYERAKNTPVTSYQLIPKPVTVKVEVNKVSVVDKTTLTATIQAAQNLTQTDYTALSWSALQTALINAISVRDNGNATQAQVDAAKTGLETAVKNLVAVGDKTTLNTTIQAAQNLTKTDYTAGSWTALETALTNATSVRDNGNASQIEIDAANTSLIDAVKNLVAVGDKTTLTATIQTAQNLTKTDYTALSWSALQTALTNAISVRDNANATQAQIDAANTSLTNAVKNLVAVGDKTTLTATIQAAQNLTQTDYTALSWSALQTALTNAISVRDNANATQAQVDAANTSLTNAVKNLVAVGNKTTLNATIQTAQNLTKTDYTAGSWTALETALTNATSVRDNGNATQAQVDAANTSLTDAVKNLVLVPQTLSISTTPNIIVISGANTDNVIVNGGPGEPLIFNLSINSPYNLSSNSITFTPTVGIVTQTVNILHNGNVVGTRTLTVDWQ
ncbi:MAG: FIVAR domain-containing protein [Candidatus Gracilibacteria bacterium]|nr:FIVAR domain-containing protein [Candidatus Gracilibacteria bacterium]